ncbi:hypothetical protein [Algoriphagus hitonicola]|uniref:Uncharacterized protein n=1 Tax=Algoriphagus hitonicola TaxID=435880 RepID=A0A1I2XEV4_9BACT|nr:hypothetical protein [Algoriphagus hitonicola]SFH12028.1 hypothetical protein SAMN04487988_11847 [Algoriphagus hitonicola]
MKNYRKKLFSTFFLLIGLGILPMGCEVFCNDSCGCGPQFEVKDFRITAFETLTLAADGQRIDPSTVLPFAQTTKSFRIAQFETIALARNSEPSFPGIAMACSPIPPKSIERMTNLILINKKEQVLGDGTILQIGDQLNPYVEINYFFASQTSPISDFLEGGLTLFSDDLFKLVWQKDPGKEMVIEFDLQIELEGGRAFVLPNEILSIR